MNNDVLPTFEAHSARIDAVLSDNGREFCGREDQHPYELFLQLEGRTQAHPHEAPVIQWYRRAPARTLLDEHFLACTSGIAALGSIPAHSDSRLSGAAPLVFAVRRSLSAPTSARPGTLGLNKGGAEHRRPTY